MTTVHFNPAIQEDRPPAFSDEALALQFAEQHANGLRYVAAWGKWLSWTGSYWRFDDTLLAYDLVRKVCRDASSLCNDDKIAPALASARTVAAVERLSRSDRLLAATIDQWDKDLWLLNAPSGVVDLKTGATRPHRPDDYITKITAVSPGGKCERFLKFLGEITGGDVELQAYLQRVFGYALTGCTREHALFFGYGTGANGKTVLLTTISGIMGSYHEVAPIETFTISNMDRHPTELAGLVGARLVSATETEEGRRWAESRVKQLTGGDAISARFMRQDFFKYLPAFKLFITGNHKPSLRSVDEAIRRRFHLVPFSVTIPSEQRDDRLSELLKAEWPGILQWAIDGCVKWQKGGLQPPKAVRDATEEYLVAEDAIGAWLEERCKRVVTAWTGSTELFVSWRAWAEQNGETAGTSKALTTALVKRGFGYVRRNTGKGFSGIRVIHEGVGYDD